MKKSAALLMMTALLLVGCKKDENIPVTGITVSPTTLTMQNQIDKLTCTISPANATNKNVHWKSSDVTVVNVTQGGDLSASNAGTAIITVTSEDGGFSATCSVTVK